MWQIFFFFSRMQDFSVNLVFCWLEFEAIIFLSFLILRTELYKIVLHITYIVNINQTGSVKNYQNTTTYLCTILVFSVVFIKIADAICTYTLRSVPILAWLACSSKNNTAIQSIKMDKRCGANFSHEKIPSDKYVGSLLLLE